MLSFSDIFSVYESCQGTNIVLIGIQPGFKIIPNSVHIMISNL